MSTVTLWPTAVEFVEAIQSNKQSFIDTDLRNGKPVFNNRTKEPLFTSGGFATVCYITHRGNKFAVKYFVNPDAERCRRYATISGALSNLNLPYTIDFKFLDTGVDINGSKYPIVKMQFIDGTLLHKYLEENLGDQRKLKQLANSWLQMSSTLRQAHIAHGDLQHRNVFVVGDQLRLIDYDGMYVNQLQGSSSSELGLPSFQHPGREPRHFGAYIDHFSDWVMYTTIVALSRDTSLWSLVDTEDQRLLFSRGDFRDPENSPLFSRLKNSTDSELSFLVNQLEAILKLDVEDVPGLVSSVGLPSPQNAVILDPFGAVIGNSSATQPLSNTCQKTSLAQSLSSPQSVFDSSRDTVEQFTNLSLTRFNMVPPRVLGEEQPPGDGRCEGLFTAAVVLNIILLNVIVIFALGGVPQFLIGAFVAFMIFLTYLTWLHRAAIVRFCRRPHTSNLPVQPAQAMQAIIFGLTSNGIKPSHWEQCSSQQYGTSYRVVVSRVVNQAAGTVLIGDINLEPAASGTLATISFVGNAASGVGYMLWDPANAEFGEQLLLPRLMQNTVEAVSSIGTSQQSLVQWP